MQTFLPHEDYAATAKTLDRMRLGKQRVETLQILQRLLGERLVTKDANGAPLSKECWHIEPILTTGWSNHPAVVMWRGHELELLRYQEAICNEWTARSYKDSCLAKSRFLVEAHGSPLGDTKPSWIGDEKVHRSHQSNLLRKDFEHYHQFWPTTPADLPYVWPNP